MPKLQAKKILEKFWDNKTIPIDPAKIAYAMGINVYGLTASSMGGHSGSYDSEDAGTKKPTISFNANEPQVRQRFTIAHELGHHCLEHGPRFRDSSYPSRSSDPKETAANAFAAELLMPENAVRALVEIRKIHDVQTLARAFNVSNSAMEFRLRTLGYVY